jgi:hypothetical protein
MSVPARRLHKGPAEAGRHNPDGHRQQEKEEAEERSAPKGSVVYQSNWRMLIAKLGYGIGFLIVIREVIGEIPGKGRAACLPTSADPH